MEINMQKLPRFFFSNRIEILFQQLKIDLFSHSHPLTKRTVIVPSPAIKTWLMHQLANDPELGIAAGIEVDFIDPTLNRLSSIFSPDHYKGDLELKEPSLLELSLALEKEIWRVVKVFKDMPYTQQEQWRPLLEYLTLATQVQTASGKVSKRITGLAGTLARLFLDYGRFGGRMLEGWVHDDFPGWQQQLWKSMEKFFGVWNYPYRRFDTLKVEKIPEERELQVHCFALSYLAPLHHRFIMKIGCHTPVYGYLLSPCQKFWSDILSDRDSIRLQAYWEQRGVAEAQQKALEEYLRDSNPLLANFGRLGREMALQIEDSQLLSAEAYALPACLMETGIYRDLLDDEPHFYESKAPLSLLEAVQADLVLLRNPDVTEKVPFEKYDRTIQVHAVPKPMREVQVIYDVVMSIIEKHNRDELPITPGDVIVMAPNINEYAPLIKSVFGTSESALDYQIIDLEMPAQNTFIQGFLHLLQLPFTRWDAASLLRLFEYPAFQKRHRLMSEDIHVFRNWIKVAGIRWGKDHQHRNEMLRRDHCSRGMTEDSWNGTWEDGLGRLCEGLAMFSDERYAAGLEGTFAPLDRIESTQGELLGKVVYLLRSLLEDLKPLTGSAIMTLPEWTTYLKCLCEAYFSAGLEELDVEGLKMLMQHIEAFNQAALSLDTATFGFNTIYRHLEKALQMETANYRESHLHAVQFCSLLPMRAIPAKVVILMGLQDGAFPRTDENLSLNLLLRNQEVDYSPSQVDFDRYIFLEALLSARRYFVLSYVSHAQGDAKEQPPSLLITELMTYLDKAFCVPEGELSKHSMFKHPFLAFDQRYFVEDAIFPSYSKCNYQAAVAYYHAEKQPQHNFMTAFSVPSSCQPGDAREIIVEMNELMAFARNPLKIYFNKTLGIYLDKEEDRIIKHEEELQLSALDTVLLSREGLFAPISGVLARAEKVGRLPRGAFKQVGMEKVLQETDELKSNLRKHGIAGEHLFSIEFSERCVEPLLSGKSWRLPPLKLESTNIGRIKVVGRLENVSLQGLVVFGDDKLKEAIKFWPMLLIFCCLIKSHALPIASEIIFAKSETGKSKLANFDAPEKLFVRYLEYYFQGKMCASPLLPDWAAPILSGSVADLQKVLKTEDPFRQIFDEYLKWLGRSSPSMEASLLIEHWQATAQSLFLELGEKWYPKSLQKVQEVSNDVV